MAITLSRTYTNASDETVTDTLDLSPWLTWDDEYSWAPYWQGLDYARDGTPHIEYWRRNGARPVTLRPAADDQGLMSREVLTQLYTWADNPTDTYVLTLHDDEARTVLWKSPFITATPGIGHSRQSADERWRVSLYFMIPEV